MAANPYSLETYIGANSKRISSDTINHYVSYMKDKGYSINAENISLVERILWEAYPSGTTFQAWYTFDKDKSKDDNIKQALLYAFDSTGLQCMSIIENEKENNETTTSCQ
jgi:hypothetical protein